MRQSFALANKALDFVSYKKPWPILTREHNFTTVPGQQDYPLPADFHHMFSPSAVNKGQFYALKGSMAPMNWYRYAFNGGFNWPEAFRINPSTKMFQINPIPSTPSDLVFMYITNEIAVDTNGIPVTQYTQDSDVALVSETIIEANLNWRWRQKKGMDFSAELAEANSIFNVRYAQELASGEFDIGGRPYNYEYPITQPTVPPVFGG
jgi:hypothetical protein